MGEPARFLRIPGWIASHHHTAVMVIGIQMSRCPRRRVYSTYRFHLWKGRTERVGTDINICDGKGGPMYH